MVPYEIDITIPIYIMPYCGIRIQYKTFVSTPLTAKPCCPYCLWFTRYSSGNHFKSIVIVAHFAACDIHLMDAYWPGYLLHSLRPSEPKCRHRTGSTLTRVMAYCLMSPHHLPNQGSLFIKDILLNSTESSLTRSVLELNPQHVFRGYTFKITYTSAISQWDNKQGSRIRLWNMTVHSI